MKQENSKILLLVEDDSIVAYSLSKTLVDNGYQVLNASNGEEALSKLESDSCDLILLDIDLGLGIDGIETAKQILYDRDIPIIFLASYSERNLFERIGLISRYGYAIKDAGKFLLISSIEMAFELFDRKKKTERFLDATTSRVNESLSDEKEEILRLALASGKLESYDQDLKTGVVTVNRYCLQMRGSGSGDFEERYANWLEILHENDRENTHKVYTEYVQGIRKEYCAEYRQRTKGGTWKWILSQGRIVEWDDAGNPSRMIGIYTDITERKHFEFIQKARNHVLDALIAKKDLSFVLEEILNEIEFIHPEMKASILLLTSDGRLTLGAAPSLPIFYNEAIEGLRVGIGVGSCGTAAVTGDLVIVSDIQEHIYWKDFVEVATRAKLRACWSFPFKDDSGKVLGPFAAYYDKPKSPSKAEMDIIIEFSRITGLAVQNNKTEKERIKAEEEVKSLLLEKEILLKEVHHRIKNNMASVSSLLSLQADIYDNPLVAKALEEAQHRIMSMMLIYDKLFRSTDYKTISMKEYLTDLLFQLWTSLPGGTKIEIEKEIEEFKLDSKSLFSVGIIVNELITNAFKYAFLDGKEGKIIVTGKKLGEDKVELTVSDNGVGLPMDYNIAESKGFGLNLINILTKKKGNSFESIPFKGTKFKIVIVI